MISIWKEKQVEEFLNDKPRWKGIVAVNKKHNYKAGFLRSFFEFRRHT